MFFAVSLVITLYCNIFIVFIQSLIMICHSVSQQFKKRDNVNESLASNHVVSVYENVLSSIEYFVYNYINNETVWKQTLHTN